MQIFLSYTAQDKAIAEPIAFSLRARDHKVFFDRDDLPPGGEYDRRIEQAVERSDLFIFLISPAAIAKGRYTLTELEFARRKWRKADGRVLPVIVQPTRFGDIPGFLKSVTVLEPKGNVAAEVAAAVAPLAQIAVGGHTLVYGCLGGISGFLTQPVQHRLNEKLNSLGLNIVFYHMDLGFELSGLAFAAALIVGSAYFFRFHVRQLVIIPFVLVGWFVAIQTSILLHASYPASADLSLQFAQDKTCTDAISGGESVECLLRKRADLAEARANNFQTYWNSMGAWLVSGAIGAMITAFGVPLATRRIFSFISLVATTLAGAIVAAAWFALFWRSTIGAYWVWTCLFVPWQAVVASVIGRSIR